MADLKRTTRRARLPRICWSLAAPSVEGLLAAARAIRPPAERFVEARLDYLEQPELGPRAMEGLRRARIPAVATLRSAIAGGNYGGPLEDQLRILAECGQAGAAIIDLEIESAERAARPALARLRQHARLLVSFHDHHATPQALPAVLGRLKRFKADYYKVATLSGSHADNAALLKLNTEGRGTVLALGMGEIAMPTRVLAVARGAPFTYGAVSADQPLAPGQITGKQLRSLYRIERLSEHTAVYGVIGNPIAHSLSPAVHNAAFSALRRDAVYLAFRVEALDDFLGALPAYCLAGFSVTIPHKQGMAQAVDWADAEARDIGAVNTVVVRRGRLHGYNTDLAGITAPLEKRLKLRGKRVLVAGGGGAARAAAFAVARRGARVFVVSRRLEQATELADQVGGEAVEREALSSAAFDAIIHATPLGMHPDTRSCFFSPGDLNAPLLFETVYTPLETALVRMARSRRMKVILGLEMFIEQAARQFELWMNARAPRRIMERAAVRALEGETPWT